MFRLFRTVVLIVCSASFYCRDSVAQTHDEIVKVVATLIDPVKLATLDIKQRAINARFKQLLFNLYLAESRGYKLDEVLNSAYDIYGVGYRRKLVTVLMLKVNFEAAAQGGIFSSRDNLDALRNGKSPRFLFGPNTGEIAEVDHVVPLSKFPQFANDIANLQLLPESENLSKGDKMGQFENEHLLRLKTVADEEREIQKLAIQKENERQADENKRITNLQLMSHDYNFALPPRWSRINNEVFFDGKIIVSDLQGELKRQKLSEYALIDRSARSARAQAFGHSKEGVHWIFFNDRRIQGYSDSMKKDFYAVILGRSFVNGMPSAIEQ